MKNNKEKILKKVYQLETKKTVFEIVFKGLTFTTLILFIYLFFISLIEILKEQQSFDLLFFFRETFEVGKKYFFDNLLVFFEEIPKLILLILLVLIIFLIRFFINLKKNYKKTINKLKAIYKFFKKI